MPLRLIAGSNTASTQKVVDDASVKEYVKSLKKADKEYEKLTKKKGVTPSELKAGEKKVTDAVGELVKAQYINDFNWSVLHTLYQVSS